MSRRSWRMNLLVLIASLVVSAAVLEGAVRSLGLAGHLLTDPAFQASPDPAVPFRYKPDFAGVVKGPTEIRTNSFGCRDREYPLVRKSGTIRIAVMGDSVTFGQGVKVEQSYPKVLERALGTKFGSREVEVVNFGVQGYALKHQVERFLSDAVRFKPDIAILAPITDDLDPTRELVYVDEEGYLTKSFAGRSPITRHLRKLHTAYLLKTVVFWGAARFGKPAGWMAPSAASLPERTARMEAEVGRFVSACRGDGIVPVFALMDIEPTTMTRFVTDALRRRFPGLPVVDCSIAFGRLGPEKFVLPKDGHPNPAAHEIMSDCLLDPIAGLIASTGQAGIATEPLRNGEN